MRNLDGSPPVTSVFIAVIDGVVATNRGHMIVDTADRWGSVGNLVRVPASTQGVRLDEDWSASDVERWWEREDAK